MSEQQGLKCISEIKVETYFLSEIISRYSLVRTFFEVNIILTLLNQREKYITYFYLIQANTYIYIYIYIYNIITLTLLKYN